MRKVLLFLCITGALQSYGQTKSLVNVLTVTPKMGQEQAFETAWIAHSKKYHQADTSNLRGVYEILSGPNQGSYYITRGGMSWADFDVERSNSKEHDKDYAATITPTLASESSSIIYRWVDTLSYRPEVPATKFLVTINHIKTGKQTDIIDEIKRAIAVNTKIESPTSYDNYIQNLSGSKPVVVTIRHLKDGFKELDAAYYKGLGDKFKAAYIEMYGYPAWDKRINMPETHFNEIQQEMMKSRPDLSPR